jgi:succinate-acetate transporter protein
MAGEGDWADSAVIGLAGFAMTTMLTGLNIAGYFPGGAALALAFIWGGVAQFVAGWVALKGGKIFTGTVFVGYGSFWIALFLLGDTAVGLPAQSDMLGFWLMWTLFTFIFLINSPKHGPGIATAFVLLFLGFVLLDAVSAGMSTLTKAAGFEIFLTGLVAWYVAMAIETNANYGRKILPA